MSSTRIGSLREKGILISILVNKLLIRKGIRVLIGILVEVGVRKRSPGKLKRLLSSNHVQLPRKIWLRSLCFKVSHRRMKLVMKMVRS